MDSKRLFISLFLYKQRKDKKGNSPIILRITLDRKRETVYTGVSTNEKNWDKGKARIRGNSHEADAQNKILTSLKARLLDIYAQLLKDNKPITSAILRAELIGINDKRQTIIEAMNAYIAHIRRRLDVDVAKATLTKYRTLSAKISDYILYEYQRGDLLLSELNNAFVANFELYLKTNQNIGHNTAIKYVQFLKRIINYAITQDWLSNNPFQAYKCSLKPVIREVLSETEISIISSRVFSIYRLSAVRDIFIFSCYTGLAYADIKKLTVNAITTGVDSQLWIHTFRTKTKARVHVPLLPKALAIIQQYHEWRKETHTSLVLPVLSNQKMNSYLKEIADLCGITKPLTFHIARHTFATTIALNNGVPIESVSKMLGHTNIKTTQIYAKVQDRKVAEDMNRLREKL